MSEAGLLKVSFCRPNRRKGVSIRGANRRYRRASWFRTRYAAYRALPAGDFKFADSSEFSIPRCNQFLHTYSFPDFAISPSPTFISENARLQSHPARDVVMEPMTQYQY